MVSKPAETVERETLKKCSTRALDALGALKQATSTFQRLPPPSCDTEKELREVISKSLKQVHCEIMSVLFVTSMVVDSKIPHLPRQH